MYNDELKPLSDFMKDIQTQYQTSLGLGSSFARDAAILGNRRGRRTLGRSYYRSRMAQVQGPTRYPGAVQQQANAAYANGGDMGVMYPEPQASHRGRGVPLRGRGLCYNFQAGNCTRGQSCRFLHWA